MRGLLKIVPDFAVWFCLASASQVTPFQSNYLQESEAKAKEILSKAIQALGGEAYLKLQDVHRTGRFYQFRKDDLQGTGHFQAYEKFPSKSRFELGKKGEIININDGDKGWKIEYKVVKDQSPEEIENFKIGLKHNLDYTLKYRLDEPGMRLRYLGKTRNNLDELEGVQLIDKDNDRMKIFVSASTFLPARMEFRSPAFGKRGPTDDERQYYNYHTVEGVQVPFSTVRFANGFKASEFQVESVKVNAALPDAFFTPNFKK
jgi:outer membrane lipoprotein-sorting protein